MVKLSASFFTTIFITPLLFAVPVMAQSGDGPAQQAVQTIDTGWQVICRPQTADRAKLACSMLYEIASAKDRTRILSIEIVKQEKLRKLVVAAPLGVSLKDGVELVAGAEKVKLAFSGCQTNGCIASSDLPQKTLDAFKTAKAVSFEFIDATGLKFRSEVSLVGFAPAFAKSE